MTYKKHIYIVDQVERHREFLRERVTSFFNNTHDLPYVEITVAPTLDSLPSLQKNGSAHVLLSCPATTPPYSCLDSASRLNGSLRAILTESEPDQNFRRRVADLGESILILPKPHLIEHPQTSLYNALYSALMAVREDTLGIFGTGNMGGSFALRAFGLYDTKRIFLCNGHNPKKAEQLAEELEKKIIDSGKSSGLEIVLAHDLYDLKFNCGTLLYSIGHREQERELTRDPTKTRKDFFSLYARETLKHATQLRGYRGNVIEVSNPVSMLMYLLLAGSYKEPNRSDPSVCQLWIEGLSRDHLRGLLALIEMGREVGIFEGNGYKTSTIHGVDLHLVGTRDKYVVHRPTIGGHTLEEVQDLARQKSLPPENYTLESLLHRIEEMGIGIIRETETYFSDAYSDTLLQHLASILGKFNHMRTIERRKGKAVSFKTLPAVSHVNLFHDSSFGKLRDKNMKDEDGIQRNIKNIYRRSFPNHTMTNWEIYRKPNGEPVNSYIRLDSNECKELVTHLLEERQLILSTLEHMENLSPEADLARDQTFNFFTRRLKSTL